LSAGFARAAADESIDATLRPCGFPRLVRAGEASGARAGVRGSPSLPAAPTAADRQRTRPDRGDAGVVATWRGSGPTWPSRPRRIDLLRINDRILDAAGAMPPAELRSLGAIHLATAQQLGADLARIVTYDDQMAMQPTGSAWRSRDQPDRSTSRQGIRPALRPVLEHPVRAPLRRRPSLPGSLQRRASDQGSQGASAWTSIRRHAQAMPSSRWHSVHSRCWASASGVLFGGVAGLSRL
jgi:hypothetical protein